MTTTGRDPRQGDEQRARISAFANSLQTELARSDTKASLLLALSGAGLVALASTASDLASGPAAVAGLLGAAALLAATSLLLLAVRPNLGGRGWPRWPQLNANDLRAELSSGYQADHLRFMATLAARKFRLIRAAVDCMLAGLTLLGLAALLTATA